MPKDGDIVWFKTKDGTLIRGTLKGKTVYGGGKKERKYHPPMNNIFTTIAQARKSTWRPKTYTKKEWDVLGAEGPQKKRKKVQKKV